MDWYFPHNAYRVTNQAFRIFHYACFEKSSFIWTQNLYNKYSRNQSNVTFSISIRMFNRIEKYYWLNDTLLPFYISCTLGHSISRKTENAERLWFVTRYALRCRLMTRIAVRAYLRIETSINRWCAAVLRTRQFYSSVPCSESRVSELVNRQL